MCAPWKLANPDIVFNDRLDLAVDELSTACSGLVQWHHKSGLFWWFVRIVCDVACVQLALLWEARAPLRACGRRE